LNDDHPRAEDHVDWPELIAHGIAFCAATVIAAIVLFPNFPKIQYHTNTTGEAFGAFLTLCVIFGGLGPLITLLFFGVRRWAEKRRYAAWV